MNKTLLYAKWFCKNNHRINKELLNKLCYYTCIMLMAIDYKTNINDSLTSEEIKVLKIINRVFGYADITDLQLECDVLLKEKMQTLYECYKNEKLNERLEVINNKYFFIQEDVLITLEEYEKLSHIKLNPDNVTYYVSRDDDGILEVY